MSERVMNSYVHKNVCQRREAIQIGMGRWLYSLFTTFSFTVCSTYTESKCGDILPESQIEAKLRRHLVCTENVSSERLHKPPADHKRARDIRGGVYRSTG
jgi:hypothetical protein